ncbi:MAG: hypothetical protein WA949_09740 [Phormidesmis sp.]
MKAKQESRRYRTIASAFAMSLCLVNTVGFTRDSNAQDIVIDEQVSANCLAADSLSPSPTDNTQPDNIAISIATRYEDYRNSVNKDFLNPLEVIAKKDIEQRTEKFVLEESNLDIETTKTKFLCFKETIENTLAILAERLSITEIEADTNLRNALLKIDDNAQIIQDTVISPLISRSFNPLARVFVGKDDDRPEVIANIQNAIPKLAANPEIQDSLGLFDEPTFQGIKQFIESQNALIESDLSSLNAAASSDAAIEALPVPEIPSQSYFPWILGLVGLLFLVAVVILLTKRRPPKSSSDNAQQGVTRSAPSASPIKRRTPAVSLEKVPVEKTSVEQPSVEQPSVEQPSQPENLSPEDYQKVSEEVIALKQEISKLREQINHQPATPVQPLPTINEVKNKNTNQKKAPQKAQKRSRKPISISELALIKQYALDYTILRVIALSVEQTENSLRNYLQGSSRTIQLEANAAGKYWVISSKTADSAIYKHYLLLRKDIPINEHRLTTVHACFLVHDQSAAKTKNGFDLVSPAIVELRPDTGLWTLMKKGEIRFKADEQLVEQ